jgi:serine/threonine protein kinase
MNETTKICPKCQTAIPLEAPQGLCPKCVLSEAIDSSGVREGRPRSPAIERIKSAFPQLEILELIGAGGMGAVFKARQSKLDRLVALKVLSESMVGIPGFADRFEREARVLARLNHANIVGVYDFGQAEKFFYLLMEFVDGVNLRQAMNAGRFSPSTALGLVSQLCDAVQYAHNEGILHRDIKPENILLDTRGRVKIADFGIAKLLHEKAGAPQLTASGAVLGTPHYMAPEQLEKPADVDQRADVYSLGVVFYEMLTGELPIGRFSPPSEKSSVDPRVDPIVLRALEKERERRYGSAGEVKSSVDHITSSPAAAPAVPPRQETVGRTTARGATASLITSLLSLFPGLLVVLAGLLFFLPSGYQGRPSSISVTLILVTLLLVAPLSLAGFGLGVWALHQIWNSAGQLRGLFRAMVGVLLWPMLLLIYFVSRTCAVAVGGFLVGSPRLTGGLILTCGFSLLVCCAITTLVWFMVTTRQDSRPRAGWWLTPLAAIAILLVPTLLISMVNGNVVAQWNNFSQRGPEVRQAPNRFGEGAFPPPGGINHWGPLVVRFGIPAGKGVLAELVINDRNGITALPDSGGFLLASPESEAHHALLWTPKNPTDTSSREPVYIPSWGVLNSEPAITNLQAEVVLPAGVANRLKNHSSEIAIDRLDLTEAYTMWFAERNGPSPGFGVRFTPFTHNLKTEELALAGFAGFGTNWVEAFHR